jgi:hypothetical protein
MPEDQAWSRISSKIKCLIQGFRFVQVRLMQEGGLNESVEKKSRINFVMGASSPLPPYKIVQKKYKKLKQQIGNRTR